MFEIIISGFFVIVTIAAITLFVLIIRALLKYIRSGAVRKEKERMTKSLGELLKENRIRCKMTQEFVAEQIGVSRQAVSRWKIY